MNYRPLTTLAMLDWTMFPETMLELVTLVCTATAEPTAFKLLITFNDV